MRCSSPRPGPGPPSGSPVTPPSRVCLSKSPQSSSMCLPKTGATWLGLDSPRLPVSQAAAHLSAAASNTREQQTPGRRNDCSETSQGALPDSPASLPLQLPAPLPAQPHRLLGNSPSRPGLSAHWHTSDDPRGVPGAPICPHPDLSSHPLLCGWSRCPDVRSAAATRAGGEDGVLEHLPLPITPASCSPCPLPPAPHPPCLLLPIPPALGRRFQGGGGSTTLWPLESGCPGLFQQNF